MLCYDVGPADCPVFHLPSRFIHSSVHPSFLHLFTIFLHFFVHLLQVQNATLVHHVTDVHIHSCLVKPVCLSQTTFWTMQSVFCICSRAQVEIVSKAFTTFYDIMNMQEDDPNAQPRIVYMHKCVELECWPATAVVSQLHLTHINLSYVIMDDKSKQLSLEIVFYIFQL